MINPFELPRVCGEKHAFDDRSRVIYRQQCELCALVPRRNLLALEEDDSPRPGPEKNYLLLDELIVKIIA